MVERLATSIVRERLRNFPAVALLGPRQCGKTTLAQSLGGRYFDLESAADRRRLDATWDEVLRSDALVILDEAQEAPEWFLRLRGVIDERRKVHGRFLLLGSVAPALMRDVSESLAGRIALVELTPFLVPELGARDERALWMFGGYPDGGILDPSQYPIWARSHLSMMGSRDLPNWGLASKPSATERLFRMLAAEQGQRWNGARFGQSLGRDAKTVSGYLEWLEGAYLIRRLRPFAANLRKRLIKTPKIYWRDSGLLHALLLVSDQHDLLGRPFAGASYEGFVIEQVLGALAAAGRHCDPYYFRTSDDYEVDLLLDCGKERLAIEVKLTSRPTESDVSRFLKAADLAGATARYLVSRWPETVEGKDLVFCPLHELLARVIAS